MKERQEKERKNVLTEVTSAAAFRAWLSEHHGTETECWVRVKRGKPTDPKIFYYLDAVEQAICFGWIDSVWKHVDGDMWSRFTPRKRKSPWTELNKARVRRLEFLGLMTEAGRAVLPDMDVSHFEIDEDVLAALKEAGVYETFQTFPPLYRRIRAYNVAFYKGRTDAYEKALSHLIEATRKGETYGEWNDYGRLPED